MKTLLLLLLPLLALTVAYTDLNDNFLIETMLKDKTKARKETQDFSACLVDEGPCDGFNGVAKLHAASAMSDGCAECDMIQKRGAVKFLTLMKSDFPDLYEKFETKYDPTRTNYPKMVQQLSGYNE